VKSIDAMKDEILATYPRLGLDDSFSFRCHPGLSCFNQCCGDVNIFLTPYDILRLKKRLNLSSTEFLARHTLKPFTAEQKLPVVVLKMEEGKEGKPCPFVRAEGCSVYEDRPWPCRMYPVGVASGRTEDAPEGPEFYFLMKEEPCDGFGEGTSWTIRKWMENQGVPPYDAMGALFKGSPGIVDCGSTAFFVPSQVYAAATAEIAKTPAFQETFGNASWFDDINNCKPVTKSKAELDASLPSFTLKLGGNPPITVESPATESYLVSIAYATASSVSFPRPTSSCTSSNGGYPSTPWSSSPGSALARWEPARWSD
jgi:Fe-S-cluster containining protein